ncbi:MAG: SUMF1/EgtB/PvdO family nonheme iron enzyme [Mesotoga sp.]|nr:SUMF1/EgtB/PvdO family nonheme iron enzyme [Mesotoga sp.]
MMTEIPSMEMPEWIRNPGEFNIRNILKDSLCYLASGLHGHFVKCYMGNAYSFVYIDYYISREDLMQDMAEYGFKGYRVIRQESINPYRLHPGGWDALTWYYRDEDPRRDKLINSYRNDPNRNYFERNREPMNTLWKKVLPTEEDGNPNSWLRIQKEPFAEWFILERTEEYDETHNPKRFSFFFLNTEAVAAYQALYLENQIAPKFLVIPQYGFGMNWTEFGVRDQILARTIFHRDNPLPQYIIGMAGFNRSWPEYTDRVKKYRSRYSDFITVWKFSGDPARLNPPVVQRRETPIHRPTENELVFVEGGEFQMGDARMTGIEDERPVHRVRLTYDFYIGKYPVTCLEYSRFCRETGAEEPEGEYFPCSRKPVVYVNWFDAIFYCNWLSERDGLPPAYDRFGNLLDAVGSRTSHIDRVAGYRLPTEAEWEYAARGGNKSGDYIFAGSDDVDEVAWFRGDVFKRPRVVGLKSPNELGLYDMSGNVWELCSDCYNQYRDDLEINPYEETGQLKALRGGSVGEDPTRVTVTARMGAWGGYINFATGFRIAKTAPVKERER